MQGLGDRDEVLQRAPKPVQFRHNEVVTLAEGGERLVKSGTRPVRTGEAVVDVDAVFRHTERQQLLPLCGEVLGHGGATGVPDQGGRLSVHTSYDTASHRQSPFQSTRPAVDRRRGTPNGLVFARKVVTLVCQSRADGGRRCFPHALSRYERARLTLAGLPYGVDAERFDAAHQLYGITVGQLAETRKGHAWLLDRIAAVEAGAPDEGDDLSVLHAAVPTSRSLDEAMRTGAPLTRVALPTGGRHWVENSDGQFASFLAEALASGKPLPADHRISSSSAQPTGDPNNLAVATRTGALSRLGFSPTAAEPCRYGRVSVAGEQRTMVERWGSDEVVVTCRADVRHSDGSGWSEYDPATDRFRVLDVGTDRDEDSRRHGVLVVENRRTGERVAMRAAQDPTSGVWTVQHDLRY